MIDGLGCFVMGGEREKEEEKEKKVCVILQCGGHRSPELGPPVPASLRGAMWGF